MVGLGAPVVLVVLVMSQNVPPKTTKKGPHQTRPLLLRNPSDSVTVKLVTVTHSQQVYRIIRSFGDALLSESARDRESP